MEQYLRETPMLNFSAANIQKLINDRQWKNADQEMSTLKAFLYRNIGRHFMNRNIRKIRNNQNL